MDLRIRLIAKYELNYGTTYKLHILLCNLLDKEGCLVLCHIQISQTMVLLTAFLILLGSR